MSALLPKEFWRLSFLWFFNISSRIPEAKKGLFRNSLIIAIISFAIGIGALSLTLALVSGFEDTLGRAVQQSTGHVIDVLRRWATTEELEAMVAKAPPGIKHAEFYWNSQGLVVGKLAGRGILIEGRRLAGAKDLDEASADTTDYPVKVTLGKPLAKILGAAEGDTVRLLMPGVIKGSLEAKVEKLVNHGIYELDSRLLVVDDVGLRHYLKKHEPESFAKRPGDAHGIRFFLDEKEFTPKDMDKLGAWIKTYKTKVMPDVNDESLHVVYSWKDSRSQMFQGIEYNKKELSLVISLLSLVSALNIVATLVVLFLLRDRDIAILQAVGLGPRGVMAWIVIQGFILGLVSSLAGLLVGRLFGFLLLKAPFAQIPEDVYNIGVLPLKFAFVEQTGVFVFGMAVSVVCALILGLRLSKMNLVQVLGSRR